MGCSGSGVAWTEPVLACIWRESERARSHLHRAAGHGGCPGRWPGPAAGHGLPEACASVGCADLVHDLSVRVAERLRAAGDGPVEESWLRRVVRSQVGEQRRAERVRRGHPARPARDDGPAGDVVAAIATLVGPPRERAWLLSLFRMVRHYPFRPGRTLVGWPLESWAGEKSLHLGGVSVTPDQVAADVRWVLDTAMTVAGAAWVHRTVLSPLAVPDHAVELPERSAPATVEELAMLLRFSDVFAERRRAGASAAVAWRAASAVVGGQAVTRPPQWAVELLQDLEAA